MKILIVEDEFNAREGLVSLIRKISPGHEICGPAADGEEGFQLAVSCKPDLVFVDIELPKMNGLEMIQKILDVQQDSCFVILSGYAEFEYAQQAIRFGVSEYLLKPITYDQIVRVIQNMENYIKIKKSEQNVKKVSSSELLRKILLGESDQSDLLQIIDTSVVPKRLYIINLYYGQEDCDCRDKIPKVWNSFCKDYLFQNCYTSFLGHHSFFTALVNTEIPPDEMIKMINYNLLVLLRNQIKHDITAVLLPIQGWDELPSALAKIEQLNSWALTLGNQEVIEPNRISRVKSDEERQARQFDMEAISAVYDGDMEELDRVNHDLLDSLILRKCAPSAIKEKCIRYVLSVLICFRELNINIYQNTKDTFLSDKIGKCNTRPELENCLKDLISLYSLNTENDFGGKSILIRKTIQYIRGAYREKISLENIAAQMKVSPEYLSHLFTKEMGVSFSDYVKKYRIDAAKKLMLQPDDKIYEIGAKIGYKDPKYFCRIFKEVTGFSPKEYRIRG